LSECPWCGKEVSTRDWSAHIDSHKDPVYDEKLMRKYRYAPPPEGVDDPEMVLFVRCVAEKLTDLPKPGEYPSGPTGYVARLLERRAEYEHGLYDVLLGERTIEHFFSEATQAWDTNRQKVSRIIYGCLEGLQGREAREMRRGWENALKYLHW